MLAVKFTKSVRFMHPQPGIESRPYAGGTVHTFPPDAAVWLQAHGHGVILDPETSGAVLPPRPSSGALSSARKDRDKAETALTSLQTRTVEAHRQREDIKAKLTAADTPVGEMAKLARQSTDLEVEVEALKRRSTQAANAAARASQEHAKLDYAEQRHVLADEQAALDKAAAKLVRGLADQARKVATVAAAVNEAAGQAGVSYRADHEQTDVLAAIVASVRMAALNKL